MAEFLEGTVVAEALMADVKQRTEKLIDKGVTPGLGTILVGGDGPSASYVKKKHEACEAVGIQSFHANVSETSSQDVLLKIVNEFNLNPEIDAYIIQHPLPKRFNFNEAMGKMDPSKDADGLHPVNLGKLVLQEPAPLPCTPAGILAMLDHYNLDLTGKNVVVVGRGPTLGRPLSLLLASRGIDAAVTVVHSKVADISQYTKEADVVIGAVGKPSIITKDMVKPGAIVVSGGISWEGKKLLPDVDESVGEVASWITPRLGGVGPTTVALLLRNTVEAAESAL